MPTASSTLRQLLQRPGADAGEIAAVLDPLAIHETVSAVRSLHGARLQAALWQAVGTNPRLTVSDILPADFTPMQPVVFHGKNSLPAFSDFLKICCRPPATSTADVLWGYNETKIRALIGPGYYVVHETAGASFGGAAFDYTMLPASHPPGWPEIRPNSRGLSRFIYNGTIDFMRRVARDVFIGSATRAGREMGNYFVLAREWPRSR
jgi:hypothetical protein